MTEEQQRNLFDALTRICSQRDVTKKERMAAIKATIDKAFCVECRRNWRRGGNKLGYSLCDKCFWDAANYHQTMGEYAAAKNLTVIPR